jgi:hypothetical protein
VSLPQLLPLCGLDALCISSIAANIMQDFDAGGTGGMREGQWNLQTYAGMHGRK